MISPRNLLWIDGVGGLLVGLAVLLLRSWLSAWYALPPDFIVVMGVANLAYGAYSVTLARQVRRPKFFILLLVAANLTWMILCMRWAVLYVGTASWLGLAHLILEGVYVGGLACLEWRWRESLLLA